MKKIYLSLVLLASLWGEEASELNRLSLSVNDEGAPAFSVPVNWNKHYFSAVSYASSQSKNHESIDDDRGKAEFVSGSDITEAAINVLSYQDTTAGGLIYAVGVSLSYGEDEFDSVGYAYQSSTNYFAQHSAGRGRLYQGGAYADIAQTKLANFFSYRVGLYVYPLTYLDFENTITSVPTPTYDETIHDKSMQSVLQYDLYATALIEFSSYVNLLVDATLQHRNLERPFIDYASSSRQDYVTVNYEYDLMAISGGAKLLFPFIAYGGISPSIGIKYTKIKEENHLSSNVTLNEETTSTTYTVGFDKPF